MMTFDYYDDVLFHDLNSDLNLIILITGVGKYERSVNINKLDPVY